MHLSFQRYQVNAENARRARWEAEAKQVIERISKKCPRCKTNTEKNGKQTAVQFSVGIVST